jgi:hypothetical protein
LKEKLLYGVGYFGEGPYKGKINGVIPKEYTAWQNMLARCYSPIYQNNPHNSENYKNCSVCPNWHNYQVFAKWYTEHTNYGKSRYALDKDLTYPGNRIYSEDSCWLVPPVINNMLKVKWGNNPIKGVQYNSSYRLTYQVKTYNGFWNNFKTLEEAVEFYHKQRNDRLIKLAYLHQDELSLTIFNNLINGVFVDITCSTSNPSIGHPCMDNNQGRSTTD